MAYQVKFSLHLFIPAVDLVGGFPAYREKYHDTFKMCRYNSTDTLIEAVVSTTHKTIPDFIPIRGMLSVCPEIYAMIEELGLVSV